MIVSGATATSSRIGLITNVKVQTTTRALSSQLTPSALLSSVVPRVPLNGCSSTGRVHSLSSTSLSRLHLTPDNAEWGGIKVSGAGTLWVSSRSVRVVRQVDGNVRIVLKLLPLYQILHQYPMVPYISTQSVTSRYPRI